MTRPLRIAMVAACPFPFPRGTPTRIRHMAEVLTRRGHEVHVVTYPLGKDAPSLPFPVHRAANIGVATPFPPGPTWTKLLVLDPLLVGTLLRVLWRQRFDLIHAHHYEGLLAGLIARGLTRIPVVYDAHTMLVSELHHYGLGLTQRAKQRVARVLERRLPRSADHIVTVSGEIAARLVNQFAVPADAVTTVAGGVELAHFEQPVPHVSSPAGKTIIFAGNLAAYQGIDLLFDAFTCLRSRRADVRLVLVSESATDPCVLLAERPELRDHVELVVGDFAALPRHLAAADVAVNPRTECDGTPLKLLNYMAAGKAIVSFAGSAKGIVDGETGLIVRNGDVSGFADALDRLLGDRPLTARLGAAAREYARRELSWDRAARSLEGVYERVLGAERRG